MSAVTIEPFNMYHWQSTIQPFSARRPKSRISVQVFIIFVFKGFKFLCSLDIITSFLIVLQYNKNHVNHKKRMEVFENILEIRIQGEDRLMINSPAQALFTKNIL